ncbi:MAG: insulinase family protein [Sulfurovum sp.]|nr:insulinase family protein [Sulfurovum sp.]
MKQLLWLVTLLTLLQAATPDTDPYANVRYFKLDNGMQVYMLADDKAEKTHIKAAVNLGYDIETEKDYGLAHLVEHLVFRDERVPHRDYLDYFKEEGATDVNGYTTRYETGYYATIGSDKSYWIVKMFAQMLFDKHVTQEDLRVEKGALQTEVGEPHWYYRPLWALKEFFEAVFPPQEHFYEEEFSLPKTKELPPAYFAQENNKRFTFEEVMQRYNDYYYPANITLFIVGNFDAAKMEQTIKEAFGSIAKKGTKSVKEPDWHPTLNHRSYLRFFEGAPENDGYIGAKYLLDDYAKYLILDSYTEDLAKRLQQHLRNRSGKTYSIYANNFSDKKAGVVSIRFDGLHDEFAHNIERVKATIAKDLKELNTTMAQQALKSYETQYYSHIEHDGETLKNLVDTAHYLREEHNITDKSSYAILKQITPDEFIKVVRSVFTPENRYTMIYRDYYFFPMEMGMLSIAVWILFIFLYVRMAHIQLKRQGIRYTQRDIVFSRRTSSRFTGFLIVMFTALLAMVVWEWIKYLLSLWLTGDPRWLMRIDVPYSYIFTVLDPLLYLLVFIVIYRKLWHYYFRIDVLDDKIVVLGNHIKVIPKEQIGQIDVVAWKPAYITKTIGHALLFWRPLVRIQMHDGTVHLIRTSNAEHLKEDLEKWKNA